jgi:hypothetical protein
MTNKTKKPADKYIPCDNCKCKRLSPCKCQKKAGKG